MTDFFILLGFVLLYLAIGWRSGIATSRAWLDKANKRWPKLDNRAEARLGFWIGWLCWPVLWPYVIVSPIIDREIDRFDPKEIEKLQRRLDEKARQEKLADEKKQLELQLEIKNLQKELGIEE